MSPRAIVPAPLKWRVLWTAQVAGWAGLLQSPCPTVLWVLSMADLFAQRVVRKPACLGRLVVSFQARAGSEPVMAGPQLHFSEEEDPIVRFRG